jgi:hypothetical protein
MTNHGANAQLTKELGDQYTLKMVILGQWPSELENSTPADVPPTVSRYFEQAADSLRAKNFDAAGVMFRKSLEVATREKAPGEADKPLVKRIDALATAGLITADMQAWAHQIRLGGNDAAHDDEPFAEVDAERLFKFTDAFLRYAYTLPAMVTASKSD